MDATEESHVRIMIMALMMHGYVARGGATIAQDTVQTYVQLSRVIADAIMANAT